MDHRNRYAPSPVAHAGKLFLRDDKEGFAGFWDVKTGMQYWRERLGAGPHASAVATLCASLQG